MNSFVDRIDKLLAEKNLTRNALYEEFNIPKNLIGIWKQRGTIPSAEIACKIAAFLETTVEYLVNGTENNPYKEKYDTLKSEMEKVIKSN